MQIANYNATAGQRISEARKAARLTQTDLATRMGAILDKHVDPTTVTRIESGQRPITVNDLVAIGIVLSVPAADFLMNPRFEAAEAKLEILAQRAEAARYELDEMVALIQKRRAAVDRMDPDAPAP